MGLPCEEHGLSFSQERSPVIIEFWSFYHPLKENWMAEIQPRNSMPLHHDLIYEMVIINLFNIRGGKNFLALQYICFFINFNLLEFFILYFLSWICWDLQWVDDFSPWTWETFVSRERSKESLHLIYVLPDLNWHVSYVFTFRRVSDLI